MSALDLFAKRYNLLFETYNSSFAQTQQIEKEKEVEENIEKYDGNFIDVSQVWEDVVAKLDTNQFYALSVVGSQGSGKTVLAMEFTVKAITSNFAVAYAQPEDFMTDIESWIGKVIPLLENTNKICIIGDDLSYANDAQSRKNAALFKNFIARIRHRLNVYAKERNLKVQVFIIYVTHRLHAVPPMLRNAGTWIFTEMQSADRDDCLEIIGKNKEQRERLEIIYTFLNEVVFIGAKKGLVEYEIDGKKYSFQWGKETNRGDGRLMCIYHAGKLNIYNTKLPDPQIDFEEYRFPLEEIEDAIN